MKKLLLTLVSLISISVYVIAEDVYICENPDEESKPWILTKYEMKGDDLPTIFLDWDELGKEAYDSKSLITEIDKKKFFLIDCELIPEEKFRGIELTYLTRIPHLKKITLDEDITEGTLSSFGDFKYKLNKESREFLEKNKIKNVITTIKSFLQKKKIEKIEQEKLEQERIEKEKREKELLEKEKLEQEKLEKEKLRKEQFEKQMIEEDKLKKELMEQTEELLRLQKERDRAEKEKQEKLEQDKLEQEKLKKESMDKERGVYLCKSDSRLFIIVYYKAGPEWPNIFIDESELNQLHQEAYKTRLLIAQIEGINFYLIDCAPIPEKKFYPQGFTDSGKWRTHFETKRLDQDIIKENMTPESTARKYKLYGSAIRQKETNGNYTLDKPSHDFLVNNGIEEIITTIKKKIFTPQDNEKLEKERQERLEAERLETAKRERERAETEKQEKEKLDLEARLKQATSEKEQKRIQEQLDRLKKEKQAAEEAKKTNQLVYDLARALKNLG